MEDFVKNYKLMKIKIFIIISIFFAIAFFGAIISWRLAEVNFSSTISTEGRLLFFGSYIGAVVGSFATIISVAYTIYFESESRSNELERRDREYFRQMKDNAKLTVMPAFSLREANMASETSDYRLTFDMARFGGKISSESEYAKGEYGVTLILKSIGVGNAWFPEIVTIDKTGREIHEHICPDNDVLETGRAMFLTIINTLDVNENFEITKENREKLPIHHELTLQCKDIYMNGYVFKIHLNTVKKRTLLKDGSWGDSYDLKLERLENRNLQQTQYSMK